MIRFIISFCLLIPFQIIAQDSLSGLYWVSASGAVNSTSTSPQRQIVRGNGYLYITQEREQITIDWGGFLGIMGDVKFTGHVGNQMLATDASSSTSTYQLTATISPGNKLMGRFVEVRKANGNEGWTTLRFRADRIDLACTNFDVNKLEIKPVNNRRVLRSGAVVIDEFKERKTANIAAKIIKEYDFDEVCFLIPPKPSLHFFTKNDKLPTTKSSDVSCRPLNLSKLSIMNESGQWIIMQNTEILLYCKTKLEAQVILALMMYHKASDICESLSLEPIFFLKE